MPDPLKESLRLAAKVCLDNWRAVHEIRETASAWPAGTVEHARSIAVQSEQMFAALVRLYLRTF